METRQVYISTGGPDKHNIIDHAVFKHFVTNGLVVGAIETHTATTNNIHVRMHITEGSTGAYTFSFSFEWTSDFDLLE